MAKGVAVTGMGIISALGNGVENNLQALRQSRHALSKPEILETIHTNLPVGEIKCTNEQLAKKLQLQAKHTFTRAALLGTLAASEAIKSANLTTTELEKTGFISGTSVGGIDVTENFYLEYPESAENRRFIQAQHPGFTTTTIAGYCKISGYITTISTACSSGANAIMLGARMILAGTLDRVIVGGTDCLSRFTLNGFNSLKILSEEFCKPFDFHRNGLNLGEGAAYLVLEKEELARKKNITGRISGFGNANDAFHQTASSENGEGAYLAMKKALQSANLTSLDINYINAHGTATINNDLSESNAIIRHFQENIPPFSSLKGFTGHSLAAAGAMEAVFSLLSLNKEQIFPNLHFSEAIPETGLVPVTKLETCQLKHVISNSFGFGGNCTSLIFSGNV